MDKESLEILEKIFADYYADNYGPSEQARHNCVWEHLKTLPIWKEFVEKRCSVEQFVQQCRDEVPAAMGFSVNDGWVELRSFVGNAVFVSAYNQEEGIWKHIILINPSYLNSVANELLGGR